MENITMYLTEDEAALVEAFRTAAPAEQVVVLYALKLYEQGGKIQKEMEE